MTIKHDGVLLLDKPIGLSSNAALIRLKRLFSTKAIGHTGALDPLATGMLPVCFGEATKIATLLIEGDKAYTATIALGTATTTGDAEGAVCARMAIPKLDHADLERIRQQFLGPQQQIPPMYSALKYQGQPLYKLAREGLEVERAARDIVLYALALDLQSDPAHLRLTVRCSKGTYIRTLGEDIALALGTVGHLSQLRRPQVGHFDATTMHTLDSIEALDPAARWSLLMSIDAALPPDLPRVALAAPEGARFALGQRLRIEQPDADPALVVSSGKSLGLATLHDHRLQPLRVFRHPC